MKFILGLLLLSILGKNEVKKNHKQDGKNNLQYIIDTDGGTDDLMAISLLLAHKKIHIKAITVVNGVAHVGVGANNIERLLTLTHHTDIPVYEGETKPISGNNAFPAIWRKSADQLPGVNLPVSTKATPKNNAVSFLKHELLDGKHAVTILALGPLTNIAKVIQDNPDALHNIKKIVVMGGAYHVPGNVSDSKYPDNAEWNFYIDPKATNIVFESGASIVQIPLDATNQVPINKDFFNKFKLLNHNALGHIIYQILNSQKSIIYSGNYYAWDPLAAASIIEPHVIKTQKVTVKTRFMNNQAGVIYETPYSPFQVSVAFNANEKIFRKLFFTCFSKP